MAFVDLVLLGDADGNVLNGGNGADRISGNDGDDIINGGGGNDIVLGGKGMDYIRGGNGSDTLYGGLGDDFLLGGSGADFLSGDAGSDSLTGGQGADVFAFNVNVASLGTGVDLVHDFVVGEDLIKIVNGSNSLVSFVDQGSSLGMYYDGQKIAALLNVHVVPDDLEVFFAA